MTLELIPQNLKSLRACLSCSIIKSIEQFERNGCDNCEEFVKMKNNPDNVYFCTSSNFEGMIAMMNPGDSWVAKWQRIQHLTPAIYAISVYGQLQKNIIMAMKTQGSVYKCRDTSQRL